MKNKLGVIFGLVLIVGTMAFCAKSFKSALINYVPIAEAKAASDTSVQIMGAPVQGTMAYDNNVHALRFAMRDDKGDVMSVLFRGPKPDDLDSAMSKASKITAQGSYDKNQQLFVADNLLVKCPSKYQDAGNSSTERSYGTS